VLKNICDGFSPDLIHVTTEFGIGFRGTKYAVSRELPLIISSHTDFCKYLKYFGLGTLEPAVERYLKWFYGFSDKTLVPSKFTLERMKRKGFKNLGIWTRGIDTNRFNSNFRKTEIREELGIGDRFAFLYVGRLSPEKGLDVLLRSIGEINRLFPGKAMFIFTGDGPYLEKLRRIDSDNVIITGFKRGHELSEIYASCDCFAFPSGTETFGNTALEALASGLPVAGIASGGVTDFLIHGQNSLLSSDGDQETFTRNLISIMENAMLRQFLSENGIRTANNMDWNMVFDSLLSDYKTIIEEKSIIAHKKVS
jgi:glycosyltransferase involved in cell wall biosynthesis